MRAMKKTVSVLLSLVLVLGMMTIGISAASAAETKNITVKSNISSDQVVKYSADSEQVTVTYELQADMTIACAQAYLTYDPAVLQLASSNTVASVVPNMTANATVNLGKSGKVNINCSDITNGYDFSTKKTFVTAVFDIIASTPADTNVVLDVYVLTGNTTEAGQKLDGNNDVDIIDEEINVDLTDHYTATASATVVPEVQELVPFSKFLYQYSSDLAGKVSLSYIFRKNVSGYDTSKLTVKFTGPKELTDQNVTVNYTDMPKYGSALYKYDYQMWSPMFSQPITCEIYYNGTKVAEDAYSIEQYILDKAATTTDPKTIAMNNALLNFGAKAQAQFNMYTDAPADRGIDYTMPTVTAADITLTDGEGVKPDLSDIGLTHYSENGEYNAATNLNIIYRVTDKTKFAAAGNKVDVDGVEYELKNYNASGSLQILTIPNVSSALLDHPYTITFSNAKTYKTSIMAQIKTRLTSQPNNEFAMSVYWYNQAANDMFGF